MMRQKEMKMIDKEGFNSYCILQLEQWYENFSKKNYIHCDAISQNHIDLCRAIIKEKRFGIDADEEHNLAYVSGVLFSGFREYVQLAELTRDITWPSDHSKTERIWLLMWNCIDRFSFCRQSFFAKDFDQQLETLDQLRKNFIEIFGHGLYSSPEIMIKKEICSICNLDVRACTHLNGNVYNGERCYSVPVDFEMTSVSLVTVPRDRRCRMWPWNFKTDNTIAGAILTLFQIDDWLREEKDEVVKD